MRPDDIGPPDVYQLVMERTAKTQGLISDLIWWCKIALVVLAVLVLVEIIKLIIQTTISIRTIGVYRKANSLLEMIQIHSDTMGRNKDRMEKAAEEVKSAKEEFKAVKEEVKAASVTAAQAAKEFREGIQKVVDGGSSGEVAMHGPLRALQPPAPEPVPPPDPCCPDGR